MQQLTPEGSRIAGDLAQRHGFSTDAVTHMMFAVLNGNGGMAQFSHLEFAGSGQWMRGGMTMIGDMFNNNLKGRVDSLCSEIAGILASQPGLLRSGSFQSQSQGSQGQGSQGQGYGAQQAQSSGSLSGGSLSGGSTLFTPDPQQNWWPRELGAPSSTGSQNNMRYAYFPGARRMAVKTGDDVWVYDTQDHQIGGFSQQQGTGSSIVFTSQYGTVDLARLPVVSRNGHGVPSHQPQPFWSGMAAQPSDHPSANHPSANHPSANHPSANTAAGGDHASILDAIARLGELKDKGILTDQEFAAKKGELLNRL